MDTSKEYVKMCDCPEIQDRWECIGFDVCWIKPVKHSQHILSRCLTTFGTYLYFGQHYRNFERRECIYLPQQDQLWPMLPKNQGYHCLYIADGEVGRDNWHFSTIDDEINEIWAETLEQALIQGVMYELHQKRWYGGKNAWKT